MRILIVRLGALGDIVHAIPVAARLRRAYADARVDWLVSARHRDILDLVPVIDERVAVRDRGGASRGEGLLSAVRRLRASNYDVVIDLQGLMKSAAIARASGARQVLGFGGRYVREPLAKSFYTKAHDPGGPGMFDPADTRHVVTINLSILEALGLEPGDPEFPLAPVQSPVAASVSAAAGGRYVLLNPGAAWPNKRWPPARLAVVARELHERHALMSVVLWGPGERPLAEAVVAGAAGAAMLSPETSIADVVALARGAALMVSGDTGPTHIAAAVGTPLVAIFGPTRPERNGPWHPDDRSVSRATVCECHHLRQCRRASMCLLDIETSEVLAAVEARMAAGKRCG